MDLETLVRLCEKWSELGWAVQAQLRAVVEDSSEEVLEEQNSAALRMVAAWLEMAEREDVEGARKLADVLEEWLT